MCQIEVNNVKDQGGKMTAKKEKVVDEYREIALDKIDEPSGVVRLNISQDLVEELGDNILEQGLFNPILIRAVGKRFEIIAGHRRYLAFKYLHKTHIPAKVTKMDDLTVALARAAENIFREDLSPIEEGAIYLDLQEKHNMNFDQISRRMKKPPSRVKRRMDLLRMPVCLQKAVHAKQISTSVAEWLWKFKDEAVIEYYLSIAIDNGVSKRVVELWIKDYERDLRVSKEAGNGGHSPLNPNEPTKYYAPCDLCSDAMEGGTETAFRACQACTDRIKEALKR
jgi:ParB family chromosome partitioning protein